MHVEIVTGPANVPNEDFAASTASGAVLIDGAGLSGVRSGCTHGVAWYARHLGGAILAGLPDEERDLTAILADAIGETAKLHVDICRLDDPGTPSATVLITRVVGERLHYLVLADSVLVIDDAATPTVITDDREAIVGAAYRGGIDAHANGTPEHDDARRRYVAAMLYHRNRDGGFWVAAADPSAAYEAIVGDRPLDSVAQLLLLSDGASRIADRFRLASWREVLALAESYGPAGIIERVRAAEDQDPYGATWPRGKVNDDATVLYCTRLQTLLPR